jgi:hypothetical protein
VASERRGRDGTHPDAPIVDTYTMDARAPGSAVLAVLGWMFVGACIGTGFGILVGFVFVALQVRGDTSPPAGEWSGLVALIFSLWGGVLGGLASGIVAVFRRASNRSKHNQPSLPPPPSALK